MTPHEGTATAFLEALARLTGGCAPTERFIMQVLPGDPGDASDNAWKPRAWRPSESLPASPHRTNGYVAISTFGRAPDNTWRRQKVLFQSARMIMVDDVDTKIKEEHAAVLQPTWKVLTSPGNEQWIYLLDGGEKDQEGVDAVINAMVDQALMPADEKDPGMKGVTRVVRVPGFMNGKAKYGGDFRVQWTQRDGPLYRLHDLIAGFRLRLRAARGPTFAPIERVELDDRMALFSMYLQAAVRRGVLRADVRPNAAGWLPVRCPWEFLHTVTSKSGTSIRFPDAENGYQGAFRCHHGHCEGRGWRHYAEALDRAMASDLEEANSNWRVTE